SLSETSREVIASLKSPLTVRAFFTEDLPAPYNNVERYLRDLLEEYADYGGRNFQYRFINPAHEKNKKELEDYGVRPIKVQEYKKDKISIGEAYMTVVIEHGDLVERLDSINSTEGLEYQITSTIKKMIGKMDALQNLKDPINVTLFATKNVPDLATVISKVRNQVEKCNRKNFDKIKFNEPVDPSTDAEALKRADEFGIQKILLRDQTGRTEEMRLGVVVEHKGRFETVHLIQRGMFSLFSIIDNLEDILNSIVGSIIGINPVIGYVTGHGELSYHDMREGAVNFRPLVPDMYDFKEINLASEEIPDSIKTIIINGPRSNFTEEELLKIDQFLMKGNSLLVFLDSFKEDTTRPRNPFNQSTPMVPNETGIEKLLEHYGFSIGKGIVLDTRCLYYRGESIYLIPEIGQDGLDAHNEITKGIKRLYFVKAAPVHIDEAKLSKVGAKKTVLVKSSNGSWLTHDFMPWSMYPPDESKRSQFTLAVLAEGRFESYFKGKDITKIETQEKREGAENKNRQEKKVAHLSVIEQAIRPARIFLAGTSDITKFDYQARQMGERPNAVFVQNAVDYMNGNYGVPEMRSKGLEINPIHDDNIISRIIQKVFNLTLADAVDWSKIVFKLLNILIMPAIIISFTAVGVARWQQKRRFRVVQEFSQKGGMR
ncbi:MAG: GldG family protein, partial [Spirochaetes bacterium]|nr:GldG family protein [Spirochaetota bacterium]